MTSKIRYVSRIFVLYICVLIPTILFSVIVSQISFNQIEKREEQMLIRILQDVSGEFAGLHNEFLNQCSALGAREEISPNVQDSTMGEIELVSLLNLTNLFSSYTSDIAVCYGNERLYSSNGFTKVNVYFDTTLSCIKESTEKGVAALNATSFSTVWLQTENAQDVLMLHYPLLQSSNERVTSVQFFIPVKQIVKVLETYASDSRIMFRMVVGEDIVLFLLDEKECVILKEELGINLEEYKYLQTQKLMGGEMELELYFNPKASSLELRNFQSINIGFLSVGIFLSVFLSFTFSRRRWKRFRTLISTKKVKEDFGKLSTVFNDEFEYMHIMLEQSRLENEQVEKNAENYRHGMLRQMAVMIFHGLINKEEKIKQMLATCDLDMSEEYYYLCGILLEDQTIEIQSLEEIFGKCLYCETKVNNKKSILFLKESSVIDQKCTARLRMANHLCTELLNQGVIVDKIVLSQMYDKLSMVNYAYLEVIGLLENPLLPNERIECWDWHQQFYSDRLTQIQFENLERYIEALEHQNLQEADVALNSMLARNIGNEDDERKSNQYYLRYCIRQALILAIRGNESEQNVMLLSRTMQINPAVEVYFRENVLKILQEYCVDDRHFQQLEAAVEYVRNNYNRYDLSLEEVANYIGISKSQISKMFKNQLGIGYLDFLTKLRLHKAQELLANTDHSVKSILLEVGYIDKTSFTKKFKANFGMTPSEYRCQRKDIKRRN